MGNGIGINQEEEEDLIYLHCDIDEDEFKNKINKVCNSVGFNKGFYAKDCILQTLRMKNEIFIKNKEDSIKCLVKNLERRIGNEISISIDEQKEIISLNGGIKLKNKLNKLSNNIPSENRKNFLLKVLLTLNIKFDIQYKHYLLQESFLYT